MRGISPSPPGPFASAPTAFVPRADAENGAFTTHNKNKQPGSTRATRERTARALDARSAGRHRTTQAPTRGSWLQTLACIVRRFEKVDQSSRREPAVESTAHAAR